MWQLSASNRRGRLEASKLPMPQQKLESRASSCSGLVRGAAAVVDMAAPSARSVADSSREEVSENLVGLSMEELQAMLKDRRIEIKDYFLLSYVPLPFFCVHVPSSIFLILLKETEEAMLNHELVDHAESVAIASA